MKRFFHSCYLVLSLVILSFSIAPCALAWTRDEYTDEVDINSLCYQIHYGVEYDRVVGGFGILCGGAVDTLDNILRSVTIKYSFYGDYGGGPDPITGYVTAPVTLIGKFAFNDRTSLKSVTIPEFITVIYSDPDTYYSGHGAFDGCTGITELNWNARNCSTMGYMPKKNIERVTIGPEVTLIPDHFVAFSKITEVIIPNCVKTIGVCAFFGCSSLTSIDIPNSVTEIGASAFSGCSGLINANIGNSITTISELAFSNCTGLANVKIPNSVRTIDNFSFSNSGLINVNIPNSVNTIGTGAFSGCSSMTSISIPNSVNSISAMTFYLCTNLASAIIPYSVSSIAAGAFYGCSNLTEITCFAKIPPTTESNAFTDYNATLRVPRESVELYRTTSPWSNFYNIVEIDDILTGDVDGDGYVTISDLTAQIDYLLSGDATGISLEAADCNNDGSVSISDITALIDYLLLGSW